MDKCDCCGTTMKHKRVGPTYLFVCDDCRTWGMKRLSKSATALQVGIKATKE